VRAWQGFVVSVWLLFVNVIAAYQWRKCCDAATKALLQDYCTTTCADAADAADVAAAAATAAAHAAVAAALLTYCCNSLLYAATLMVCGDSTGDERNCNCNETEALMQLLRLKLCTAVLCT
jgi:hypothetical protein